MNINFDTSHPSAFISSTFLDLKPERSAAADILRESGLNINALDIKPASTESSRKEILNGIRESDFIILIVGERYGSMIKSVTLKPTLSITRWEYERAVKDYKKDVLVYFKRVNSNEPIYYDDRNTQDYEEKRSHLRQFKKELSDKHTPKYFDTPDELADELKRAIIPTYRNGVRSLARSNNLLSNKVESLEKEIERIKSASKPNPSPHETSSPIARGLSYPSQQDAGLGFLGKYLNPSTKK